MFRFCTLTEDCHCIVNSFPFFFLIFYIKTLLTVAMVFFQLYFNGMLLLTLPWGEWDISWSYLFSLSVDQVTWNISSSYISTWYFNVKTWWLMSDLQKKVHIFGFLYINLLGISCVHTSTHHDLCVCSSWVTDKSWRFMSTY